MFLFLRLSLWLASWITPARLRELLRKATFLQRTSCVAYQLTRNTPKDTAHKLNRSNRLHRDRSDEVHLADLNLGSGSDLFVGFKQVGKLLQQGPRGISQAWPVGIPTKARTCEKRELILDWKAIYPSENQPFVTVNETAQTKCAIDKSEVRANIGHKPCKCLPVRIPRKWFPARMLILLGKLMYWHKTQRVRNCIFVCVCVFLLFLAHSMAESWATSKSVFTSDTWYKLTPWNNLHRFRIEGQKFSPDVIHRETTLSFLNWGGNSADIVWGVPAKMFGSLHLWP